MAQHPEWNFPILTKTPDAVHIWQQKLESLEKSSRLLCSTPVRGTVAILRDIRSLRLMTIGLRNFTISKIDVSSLDQLFLPNEAIIMVETSTSSVSFRSSELSQPI
jgi:hypothetical protein